MFDSKTIALISYYGYGFMIGIVIFYWKLFQKKTPDMEKLVAISDLFEVSLDELVLGKAPDKAVASEQIVKSEFYSDIKEHILTEDNKKKG